MLGSDVLAREGRGGGRQAREMSLGQGRDVIAPPAARTFGEHFARAVHHDLGQRLVPEEGVQGLEIALEHALLRGAPFD